MVAPLSQHPLTPPGKEKKALHSVSLREPHLCWEGEPVGMSLSVEIVQGPPLRIWVRSACTEYYTIGEKRNWLVVTKQVPEAREI